MKLVVRDQQGQFSLTCPTCRQTTPIPSSGVTGLQSAFRINHLLEILEQHKKAIDTTASQGVVESDEEAPPIPPKKIIAKCLEHTGTEQELYCETCEGLICLKCAIKGGKHHNHEHYILDEAFEKYKEEVAPSLESMEGKLEAVKEALSSLDEHCEKINNHQEAVKSNIYTTFDRLQETLNIRKTELISQVHEITQRELKDLAVQRDQMETILAQLSSCLDFVRESLKTDGQEEVLALKSNIKKQVKELTSPFQPDSLEEPNMEFLASEDMIARCYNYGKISSSESPDPSKFQAIGKGLESAVVGEKSTIVLQAMNFKGEPSMEAINSLWCKLKSEITGVTDVSNFKCEGRDENQYKIGYQPTIKGKHQLSIKFEDTHIKGSPFTIVAKLPVEKLGNPILTISEAKYPRGVAVNDQRGEVVVTEEEKDCVSIFRPNSEKLSTFGSHGSSQGHFNMPQGVAVDGAGNILVADAGNHRIQKFTANGQFLSAVGTKGKRSLQFSFPSDVAFNACNNKLYVTDKDNHRVQVLNSDLSFFSTFGKEGSGKGHFKYLHGIACDSIGKVYITDTGNNRIQVFTANGKFHRMFGKSGSGTAELNSPCNVAIDTDDIVYVSEINNHRVSVFTSEGQFITSLGSLGEGPGEFKYPHGVAVDSSGVVYVCDIGNNRVQVF